MEYNNDLEKNIDGFLKYCDYKTNISSKKKLKILNDIKMSLEIDAECAYATSCSTEDNKKIEKFLEKMSADNMAVKELKECINYLKCKINEEKKLKKEKYLHFIKKCVKI